MPTSRKRRAGVKKKTKPRAKRAGAKKKKKVGAKATAGKRKSSVKRAGAEKRKKATAKRASEKKKRAVAKRAGAKRASAKKRKKATVKKKWSARSKGVYKPRLESTVESEALNDGAVDGAMATAEGYGDVADERATVVSLIKDLEGQVDTAYKLKEALEVDLDATQKKLAEESAARAELEIRLESFQSQTALVDQLREGISFAEEERNKFANLLAEIEPQLEALTGERDALAKEAASAGSRGKRLEREKTVLQAQVMNLKDKVEQMDHLSEEARELRERLADAEDRVTDLSAELEEQLTANRDLVESTARLESELRMASVNHEATRRKLEAVEQALHEIYSETRQTSGRIRQHYVPKAKDKE